VLGLASPICFNGGAEEGTQAMEFKDFINIAQILVATVLTLVILLQAKGSGIGAAFGGGTQSSFRTRRGVEKTLFQLTIILAVVFLIISAIGVRASLG
jgi:preprotein translocase subunit SecG